MPAVPAGEYLPEVVWVILDITCYDVMDKVYVRIRVVPSLGEGSTQDAYTLLEHTYEGPDSESELEGLLWTAGLAAGMARSTLVTGPSDPPF